jgi:hypothetical protein
MADDLEIGTFFTVTGFIPDPTRRCDLDGLSFAERYQWQGDATTPRMAEDLAKADWSAQCDERGLDHELCPLFVTAVYEGKVNTLDTYARFLNPDIRGE